MNGNELNNKDKDEFIDKQEHSSIEFIPSQQITDNMNNNNNGSNSMLVSINKSPIPKTNSQSDISSANTAKKVLKHFNSPLITLTQRSVKHNNNNDSNSNNNEQLTHVTSVQIYKNKIPLHARNSFTTSSSIIASKIKESEMTSKDKKNYLNKVESLKKRIIALKKQQDEIDKKHQWYEKKNKESEMIKQDKRLLQEKIIKVEDMKRKEIEAKKQQVKDKNNKLKSNIQQNAKETLDFKKKKYSSSVDNRKKADNEANEFKKKVKEENQKQHDKAKEQTRLFKEEENKKLLSKEQDITNYYMKKVEQNQKESKMLQDELGKLEKMEKEVWKKLKESQKKADEINRISVNKIKDPNKYNLKDKNNDKSILSPRTTNKKSKRHNSCSDYTTIIGCASPKPFVVRKIGFDDSYHNLHKSKRSTSIKK